MRAIRYRISDFLFWVGDKVDTLACRMLPAPTNDIDLADVMAEIEPSDTPFMRRVTNG